jgi:hypothetical protein
VKGLVAGLLLAAAAVLLRKPLGRLLTRTTGTWVGSSGS